MDTINENERRGRASREYTKGEKIKPVAQWNQSVATDVPNNKGNVDPYARM